MAGESKSHQSELVSKLWRDLGVPDGSDPKALLKVARRALGRSAVDGFRARKGDDVYDVVYAGMREAVILGIGWREQLLRDELAWLVDRVRDLGIAAPHVVDIGSGTGIAAVCMARAGATVVSGDPHPKAESVVKEITAQAGVVDRVTPIQFGIEDAPAHLQNRHADAVLIQAILAWIKLEHDHAPGLSWLDTLEQRFATPERLSVAVESLVAVVGNMPDCDLWLIDYVCPEQVASFVGQAAQAGLGLDIAKSLRVEGLVGGAQQRQLALRFSKRVAVRRDRELARHILNLFDPLPAGIAAGTILEDKVAELARSCLTPTPDCRRYLFTDNEGVLSILVEIAVVEEGIGYRYLSRLDGIRRIEFFEAGQWGEVVEAELAAQRRGHAGPGAWLVES